MAENSHRLSEEYVTPYDAIVREHIVMGVTRYFIERWVPVLGTAPATVINTLRQLNYHTPDQPLTISGKMLATEASMSRRHLYTCLEAPWMPAFLDVTPGKRIQTNSGKMVQEANQYMVQMQDPLSPADAEFLMLQLQQRGENPIEAATALIALNARDLWAESPNQEASHFHQPETLTAKTVLERAFPVWQPQDDTTRHAFENMAAALHNHITLANSQNRASKIIVPQYFRTHWWKYLGHDLAWSYLWLRGNVYEDSTQGIARITCWVPSLDILLQLINRPREWWRRNVEQPSAKGGVGEGDFFQQLSSQKGRNAQTPQQVARQFLVRIEMPIAPSDRQKYSDLVIDWPDFSIRKNEGKQDLPKTSLNPDEVPHIRAHRLEQGLPHLNTQKPRGSATFEHTETEGVCHICAQGSATFVHRDSESLIKEQENTSTLKNSKHIENDELISKSAAGAKENFDHINNTIDLVSAIEQSLKNAPQLRLYEIAPVMSWLEHGWPEPINPYTPAWKIFLNGDISAQDMTALMLAVWADSSINHPPRYLSWLIQQWQKKPETEPVRKWTKWQKLADISIGKWPTEGYRLWLELTPPDNRALPLGLETVIKIDSQDHVSQTNEANVKLAAETTMPHIEEKAGLDQVIDGDLLTIGDVWRAALSQLSLKLPRSIYANWIEGTDAVAYEDGVLTLRARHFMAREQLSRRYNELIEKTIFDLAKISITVKYIL